MPTKKKAEPSKASKTRTTTGQRKLAGPGGAPASAKAAPAKAAAAPATAAAPTAATATVAAAPKVASVTVTMAPEAPVAPTAKAPVKAEDLTVGQFQKALSERGFYAGAWDGEYGWLTRQAVARCQAAHNLPVDGEPTPATLAALGF